MAIRSLTEPTEFAEKNKLLWWRINPGNPMAADFSADLAG
jgi:hypothetical protein